MSATRLALRLAAYEALCPYAARSGAQGAQWPTLAGANVYDSRIDPIGESDDWQAFIEGIEGRPIVILYAEEHETDPYFGEFPADRELPELVVELMVASVGQVLVEKADGTTEAVGDVIAGITDPQREALLDLLEAQVRWLLSLKNPFTPLISAVAMELHHVRSVPQRASDKTTRLAARTVTLKYKAKASVWPLPLIQGQAAPTGFDVLPEPLRTVAMTLDPASPHGQMLAGLAAVVAAPQTLTPLEDMRMHANVGRSVVPTQVDGSDADITADATPPSFSGDFAQEFT
jgi:hypothetical protein